MLSWYSHEIATWKHDLLWQKRATHCPLALWATFCAFGHTCTRVGPPQHDATILAAPMHNNTMCEPVVCFFLLLRDPVLNNVHLCGCYINLHKSLK